MIALSQCCYFTAIKGCGKATSGRKFCLDNEGPTATDYQQVIVP